MNAITLFLLLSFSVAGFCQSERDAIIKTSKEFSSYYVNGDMKAIAESYTEDAIVLAPGRELLKGRQAIFDFWNGLPKVSLLSHEAIPDSIIISGNVAYDYGYVYTALKPEPGKSPDRKSQSKYYIIWEKSQDGKWRMKMDVWNTRDPQWASLPQNKK